MFPFTIPFRGYPIFDPQPHGRLGPLGSVFSWQPVQYHQTPCSDVSGLTDPKELHVGVDGQLGNSTVFVRRVLRQRCVPPANSKLVRKMPMVCAQAFSM